MRTHHLGNTLRVSVFLAATAAFLVGVWTWAWSSALDQTRERAAADLALSSDRLAGQLRRFRELAVLLSDYPTLMPVLAGASNADAASALLLAMSDKTGALRIELADRAGRVLASGASSAAPALIGTSVPKGARQAFARALDGALGWRHFMDADGQRIFTYAGPVFDPSGKTAGAVLVYVDIAAIEWNWPADPAAVFFTDSEGTVFVTNRSDLVLTQVGVDFPGGYQTNFNGHDLWRMEAGPYLPARALHLAQDLPVVGLTGQLLLDLRPAKALAALQTAVAGALCLAFGAFLSLATIRRRALAEANHALEERVADRTQALEVANADLRREVAERKEAEARLQRAQADLVQAGKLSALGQMSAGISHELNQPLMAIRSFAENAAQFLERGKPEIAGENLGKISELARRMGRIIQNLRAFARQEKETIADIDIVAAVDAVLEMASGTLAGAGVTVEWQRPDHPILVRGGEVRLQQVVMNLVSNAIDAMAGQAAPHLDLQVQAQGARVLLSVTDTGPGIKDPARIFDPFYSTKEVGASEGMGLGLSISYGLIQGFGGEIRGANRPSGGAVFTVELDAARVATAA